MTFEITETAFNQETNMSTVYRYDCFIDDVYMTCGTWLYKQNPYKVFKSFINVVLREWKTKYKNKYNMKKITKHDMERFKPSTIVNEEIQDIDLTLKQVSTLVRLQKMEEDFQ